MLVDEKERRKTKSDCCEEVEVEQKLKLKL